MSLASHSVARPIFTAMATLIVVVIGMVSLSRLQIDLLPKVELPTLTISTEYEGASPEVMEQSVSKIIEEIVATVPGVEELSSESSEGSSRVRVTFAWGTDIDTAALDVRSKLEDEIDELPDSIVRPRVHKFDVASFPVVILGVSSGLDPVELTTLIEEQLRYRFSQIPGVAQVDPWGGFEREVRVELDPNKVRALGVPLNAILDALRNANVDLPAGTIEQGQESVVLRAPSQFNSIEEIRETVVATRAGVALRLRQMAEVRDTYRKLDRLVRVNGQPGLRIAIRKQADANTVEVAQRVLAEAKTMHADFPQIHITPIVNQGNFIERSISNVARSVLYGGGLAILVLFLFLRDFRSTAVIAIAIPISLVATFALIYLGHFTLNLMTLGGLALGVGMMVDNSIVVLENIFRRRKEQGESAEQAAVAGTVEVARAIVASTVTTLVIFLPLVFVRGVSGILFSELAYVIVFSLAASLVVSLSIVPVLSSKWLRRRELVSDPKQTDAFRPIAVNGPYSHQHALIPPEPLIIRLYDRLLRVTLRNRSVTVLATAVALGASLLLLPRIGTEFLPPSDEGEVQVTGEMAVGTKLELVDRQTRQMESLVYPLVPETTSSVVSVGASGRNASSAANGEIRLSLRPLDQRQRSNLEIATVLREELSNKIPGMKIRTRAPQGQFLLERILGGDDGLTVEVRGFDFKVLDQLATQAATLVAAVPGVTDIDLSRDAGVPQQQIYTDRNRAADLGLSPRDVARSLEIAIAGSPAGEYRVGGQSYRILVQLADAEHRSLSEILDLNVSNLAEDPVSLRQVVSSETGRGPLVIERKDQQRTVTVSGNVAGRDMGSVAADIQKTLRQIPLPMGYELRLAGRYEEQQEAFTELLISFGLALLLVYMVLAAQYESLRAPLVVMISVPVAIIGVLVMLAATETTFNVQSYIGCIMLGGIVVNNAILLVDQARALQATGFRVNEAVIEAGRRRLRPIFMTTLTTILALLPLALGIGEGADAQAPLARTVLGGLAASTVITLVLIPTVYSLFHPERRMG